MSTMVVTGKEFNRALEEINASYQKQNDRIASLVERVAKLEEAAKPKQTAAQKKKAEEAAKAELEKLDGIADR